MDGQNPLRIALYSPDRARFYDGRTPEVEGVGGGITARLSLVAALAALGHDVTAYVHCEAPISHRGVSYVPIDGLRAVDCDIFIAISTGGAFTFSPLRDIRVTASLRILWVQGVRKPVDIAAVGADYVYVASHFLRHVCATRWRIPERQLFVCYNGLHQEYFEAADRNPPVRDPFAISYIGPPEKGLDACIGVLRRLRVVDDRFHLDVFGGDRLWGRAAAPPRDEPGLREMGLLGQRRLATELYKYEYCLALQAMEEGFGIAVQEAKRAGVIVLASRVGAFPELIQHAVDGYLIAGSHDAPATQAAAAALVRGLAENPGRRIRIRRRARTTPWSWADAARTWTAHWEYVRATDGRAPVAEPTRRQARHLLIAGFYGHGNLGDEAVLSALLDQCQQTLPDVVPIVASADPDQTSVGHDVTAVDDRSVPALQQAAAKSDLIAIGGGGLFHDYHGVDESTLMTGRAWGLTYCATWPVLARMAGRPLMIMAAGVGPLRSAIGQRLTRLVFEQADASTVRDTESRELLSAIGVDVTGIAVSADPAFLLESTDPRLVRTRLRAMGVPDGKPLISVALRQWDRTAVGRQWEASVAGALDRLIEERGATVLFVPFQTQPGDPETDDIIAARVRQLMRRPDAVRMGDPDLTVSVVQGVFEASHLVLAMRLHAVILAASARAALLAIRYDDKVSHTLARLGLEAYAADLSSMTVDSLAHRLSCAWDDRDRIRAILDVHLPAVRDGAQRSAQLAADLIRRGPTNPPAASPDWIRLSDQATLALAMGTGRSSGQRRALRDLGRSVVRRVVPAPWRRLLREEWQRQVMSPPAFLFDRFKRQRIREYGSDLTGVRAPGDAGLVSVVLPAYNGGALMREAIDSVLSQTYGALELIIVNDGSTDDTGTIADDYARRDARVRVIHQKNETLPAALSRGFREARGEFLTWTSCDNRLKPAGLQALVDCLRRHPHWDMTYGNVDLIDDDGAPLSGSPHYGSYQTPHGSPHVYLPRSTAELNTRPNNFIGAGFLYRSRVASLLGDYDRFRFGLEDYDYWMRVNALLTLRHADFEEPVVEYRFHRNSLTARAGTMGLTGMTARLMVFDHFRRDAYLSPVLWVFANHDTRLARALQQRARQAGHLIYDGTFPLNALPSRWMPVVYVSTDESSASAVFDDSDLPPSALRVLVSDASELPTAMAGSWDLCAALGRAVAVRLAPGCDGVSPGWIVVPDIDRLFHALDIRVKSRVVQGIEELVEAPAACPLKASIVICTFRESGRLAAAIDSALAQDFPADQFEVVVVNNNPADAALTAALDGRHDRVRVVVCPVPGLSAAKNAAVAVARGEYVCFLDDDAVADRNWLARLCRAFDAHPETGVAGGPILLKSPEPRPPALVKGWETYWSHFSPAVTTYTEVDSWAKFPWGANWAARRRVLTAVGGFRTSFGRKRTDFAGGEELVAAALAQRLGYRIAIVPDAVVEHHVDPERFTARDVRKTMAVRHLIAHAARRDLLAPGASGVATTTARLALHHVDRNVRSFPHILRDIAYRKAAQFNLLKLQLGEWRDRRRRPVGESP